MTKTLKAGIVVFPGTNCDRDTFMACEEFGWETEYIWHFETNLDSYDVIFLPGGFSYGDYIRSGRLAKFSPVMQSIKKFVENKQGFLIGICNGFQILCESGLLPGVLTDNWGTRFICNVQRLELHYNEVKRKKEKVKSNEDSNNILPFTSYSDNNHGEYKEINLPIAHGEGRYLAEPEVIQKLKEKNMIFLTYANNPNGSIEDIAGLYDRENRIIGMMPHPERAFFNELGNTDGKEIFNIIEQSIS
jgi:phosphoribosylformylglycinamidine synthase subunit PurQ / glutaminase